MTGVLFSDKLESGVIVPRDYQQSDVNESFRLWDSGVVGALTRIFTGGGKCLGKDTPVLLYDGRIVPVQEVRVGDQLMGPDNLPRTVLSLARGTDQMFRIVPKSGMSWTCNSEHILTLKMTNFNVPSKDGSIGGRFSGEIVDIPLNEYLDSTISFRHIAKGFRVPIEFAERPVIVDPYFLGLWLGDGSSHEPAITTADEIILDVVKSVAAANGLTVVKKKNSKVNEKSKSSTYRLSSKAEVGRARNPLWKAIREYIPETKCIPIAYKVNCRRIQLEILAGLLDTDGHLHNGGYDFISKYEQLAQDVAFVARSLGLRAVVSPCIKTCGNTGVSGTYFRVGISGDCSIIPVRLPWKKAGPRRQKKDPLMFGFSVEALGEGDYYGFTITGDGRFLLGDFTVTHNTLASSFKFKRWLERSPEHRCMVLSYEQQLVWQFAEEVRDFLGIEVGVEMSGNEIHPSRIPRVVVACRQSLMAHELATVEQREALATYGITDLGLLTKSAAKRALSFLKRGCDITDIQAMILQHNENYRANQETGRYSRLHKFDYRWPWLVVFDEAHKYSMRLATVGHVVEWFEKNPESRRSGITATPKRSDNVCIQSKLFPGVSIDYPYRDAVRDGYAVPFDQRFIQIEGVDFRRLKEESKGSIEKWDSGLDEVLNTEEQLAKLCQPMLDMVGNRQTLIFSPSVSMARNVAEFLNARVKCECSCATVAWYPTRLLGDGAKCVACGEFVSNEHVISSGVVARAVYGEMPPQDRRAIYADHQSGKFQFLSVCSLCLAKGTLILTDWGEVPIEHVTTKMKVWDGIEFVSHDGVVCHGTKPVIEYEGLRATEDHHVWTSDGWKPLAECKQERIALCVSGIDGNAIRESDGYYRRDGVTRQMRPAAPRHGVRSMWRNSSENVLLASSREVSLPCVRGQEPELRLHDVHSRWLCCLREIAGRYWGCRTYWQVAARWIAGALHRLRARVDQAHIVPGLGTGWMQVVLQAVRRTVMAFVSLSCCQAAMHEPASNRLSRLWRTWDSVPVSIDTGDGQVDFGEPWRSPEHDPGQDRQQWPLLPREFAVRHSVNPSQQPEEADVYDIVNAGPRNRFTANGVIVSNCKEGYNDPEIAAVAVFRPVSKAAASLAEQMKGRASRPERGCINGLNTVQERLEAIANSRKPRALVIDLVGITGLADCASTVQIFADGLEDEVVARAEEIALEGGMPDPQECIAEAQRQIADEKAAKEAAERIRQAREAEEERRRREAAERARFDAKVKYSVHQIGSQQDVGAGMPYDMESRNSNDASEKQLRYLHMLGMDFLSYVPTKAQAGRMITLLTGGNSPEDVAYLNHLNAKQWKRSGPSSKQVALMLRLGIANPQKMTPQQASRAIDRAKGSQA